MVPDEEVLTCLARDEHEIAADRVVPDGHREDDEHEPQRERPGRCRQSRAVAAVCDPEPQEHDGDQHQVVAAGEAREPEHQAAEQPLPLPTAGLGADEPEQRQRDQEDGERHLQNQRVVVEEGLVEDGEGRCYERRAPLEELGREAVDEGGGSGAEKPLGQEHPDRAGAEDPVEAGEEVGIERILVEDALAEPGSREDLERALVVGAAVHREEADGAAVPYLPEVEPADAEGECEDEPRRGELATRTHSRSDRRWILACIRLSPLLRKKSDR